MANPACTCGHVWQQHKAVEDDPDLHEGECEVEGCDCQGYESVGWEGYVDEYGYA